MLALQSWGYQSFMLNLNSLIQSCCGGMEHMENHLPQSLNNSKPNLPFLTVTDSFVKLKCVNRS